MSYFGYTHSYGNVPQQQSILECDICHRVIIKVTGDLETARAMAVRQAKPALCFPATNKDVCHKCANKKKNKKQIKAWSRGEDFTGLVQVQAQTQYRPMTMFDAELQLLQMQVQQEQNKMPHGYYVGMGYW